MIVHIAEYRWKDGTSSSQIEDALAKVRALRDILDGVLDIRCGENYSRWNKGYTHAIVVLAKDQAGLDAYREHPDHAAVAAEIEAIEADGIGIDFEDSTR